GLRDELAEPGSAGHFYRCPGDGGRRHSATLLSAFGSGIRLSPPREEIQPHFHWSPAARSTVGDCSIPATAPDRFRPGSGRNGGAALCALRRENAHPHDLSVAL